MTKTIDTLVPDIYALLTEDADHKMGGPAMDLYGSEMADHLGRALSSREHGRDEQKLYASEYGDKCHRKLWFKVNYPELGEPLAPHTRFKFLYGDILESAVLALAKQAGHNVLSEQQRIEHTGLDGVKVTGRLDAVIDGHVVDVKSMSTYGFNKLRDAGGLTEENDSFGYRWQVALYQMELGNHEQAYILGIDKQNGHIGLFPVDSPDPIDVGHKAQTAYQDVYESEDPPPRGYEDEPDGKSGNRKLGVACSYCSFKEQCWPGLRTFAYSRGPVFLTRVEREPKTNEVTSDG